MEKPNLNDYLAFIGVAECSGYSAAARELNIEASVLSRRVSRLEAALGAKLFYRTTRRVDLTEKGRLVYAKCAAALNALHAVPTELEQAGDRPSGTLTIATSLGPAMALAQVCLAPFLKRYPEVDVIFRLGGQDPEDFDRGTDLAIVFEVPSAEYKSKRLVETGTALYTSGAYLDGRPVPVDLAALQQHEFLGHSCDEQGICRITLTGPGDPITFTVKPRLSVPNFPVLRQLVLDGCGVALLPRLLAEPLVRAGALIPILASWSGPTIAAYAVWPKDIEPLPKTRAWIDFVCRKSAELTAAFASISLDLKGSDIYDAVHRASADDESTPAAAQSITP